MNVVYYQYSCLKATEISSVSQESCLLRRQISFPIPFIDFFKPTMIAYHSLISLRRTEQLTWQVQI